MATVVPLLTELGERILPMFEHVQREYTYRVHPGYPIIVNAPERGAVGLELEPNHSLYLISDGDGVMLRVTYRSSRYDTRNSASREKFGGTTVVDDRPIGTDITDEQLRNAISELLYRFNFQQTMLYFTDH
jgi:hypothetical protein